jgi:hypothetical protein
VVASKIYYTSYRNVSPTISIRLKANKSQLQRAVQQEDALNLLRELFQKRVT